jgi:hypothetical protein
VPSCKKKVPRLPIHIQILTNAAKSYNIKQMHCLSRFGFVLGLIKFIEKYVSICSIKQMHCQKVLLMHLINVASYCECLSFFFVDLVKTKEVWFRPYLNQLK